MKIARTVLLGLALAALVIAGGCAPAGRVSAPAASASSGASSDSLPASLDGLAFVADGTLYRVSGGKAAEVARDGHTKLGVVTVRGDNGLLVTEASGDGARVVLVRGGGTQSMDELLRVNSASALLGVRLDTAKGRLYRAVDGDPSPRLVASGIAKGSAEVTVALEGSFSGEFDIDELGLGLVYTSATQSPATLRSGGGPKAAVLTTKLATAFAPCVSANGNKVCLIATKTAGEPVAVWVFDRGPETLRRLDSTAKLAPSHPVFSGDGSWIAFRSDNDGKLHVVRADGTGGYALPFAADDATIAW